MKSGIPSNRVSQQVYWKRIPRGSTAVFVCPLLAKRVGSVVMCSAEVPHLIKVVTRSAVPSCSFLTLSEVNSGGSDERNMATSYFIRCGYGMHRYTNEHVEQKFDGLNWLRWPQYEKKARPSRLFTGYS